MDEGKIIFKGTVTELLDKANGNIYEAKISKAEIQEIKKKYIVTNVLMMSTEANVRFIAESESEVFKGAEVTPPNVEDAYMYLMHINGGAR